MKKIFLILTVFILFAKCYAQNYSWAKTYGGVYSESARNLSIDASNNLYVVGTFSDTLYLDYPTNSNSLVSYGRSDFFVLKLNDSGEQLWSMNIGSGDYDSAERIHVDSEDNLLIGGWFRDTVDFNPGIDSFVLISENADQFILKLNANGEFMWVNYLVNGSIRDLITDDDGNIYSVGRFSGELKFEINGQQQSISANWVDTYIQKIDKEGNTLWVKTFGGQDSEIGKSIRVDSEGNIYCAGEFADEAVFDSSNGTIIIESEGEYDLFFMKMDSQGEILWAKGIGSPAYDIGPIIEVRSDDQIYLTGKLDGKLYLALFDKTGTVVWDKEIHGATSLDFVSAGDMLAEPGQNIFITGVLIGSIDFDPSNESNILSTNTAADGDADGFIAKYNSNGELVWINHIEGEDGESGKSLAIGTDDNLFLLGGFGNNIEINSGSFSFSAQANGESDFFIAKFIDTNSTDVEEIQSAKVNISPNPCSSYINIALEEKNNKNVDVIIFNQSGQVVKQTKISKKENLLGLGDLPNGAYLVQLIFSPTEIIYEKIVVQKN